MNKNIKIALGVLMGLIVLITIIVFAVVYFTSDRKDDANVNSDINTNAEVNTNTDVSSNTNSDSNTNSTSTNSSSSTGTDDIESFLKPIAQSFAERFGSYSTHSDFENITKLEPYMSVSMKNWAENYVAEQKLASDPDAEYYGISTKAITVKTDLVDEEGGEVQYTVSTQRNESREGEESKILYQDIVIKFVLQDEEWKVNSADWQ